MAATYFISEHPGSTRVDGTGTVMEATQYADSLLLPRRLHGKLLRSRPPYTRLLSVDTSKAAALSGVFVVRTRADLLQPSSCKPCVNRGGHRSYGMVSVLYPMALQTVTYQSLYDHFEDFRVFTNKLPRGLKRRHGTPQPCFALQVYSCAVIVFCVVIDMSQGSDSVLVFIVAEELGLEPRYVRLITADTALAPIDLGSSTSRVTFIVGNAMITMAPRKQGPLLKDSACAYRACFLSIGWSA